MRTTLLLALAACAPSTGGSPTDGMQISDGPDATDVVVDPGQPIDPSFVQWSPPRAPYRISIGSIGGTAYVASTLGVEGSDDLGQTWTVRGAASSMTVTSAALFDQSPTLRRSTDGAARWVELTLPDTLPPGEIQRIHLDGEGQLWVLSRANPPIVARSEDLGDSFELVDLPEGTTTLAPCDAAGGVMTAVRSYADVVQWKDDAWVTLGAAENPGSCFVSAEGTVLLAARDTETVELRWPQGADDWERRPGLGAVTWRQVGDDLTRILTNGRVDRSPDDGISWTAQASAPGDPFVVAAVTAIGDTLVGLYGASILRLGPTDTAWEVQPSAGVPAFLRVADFTFAENGRMAMILTENISRVLYVQDADGLWWPGAGFTQADAQIVALSPDGERAFVGGATGGFRIVDDRGRTVTRVGRLNDIVGNTEDGRITGAAWGLDGAGNGYVVVSAATEDDRSGGIWVGGDNDDFGTWRRVTPTATATSFAVRPGGYYALALGRREPPVDEVVFAGMRSWVSAGSYTQQMLYKPNFFDSFGVWFEEPSPVGFLAPVAAAWNGRYLAGLATLWPGNQLYYGFGAGFQQPVALDDVWGEASAVRIDPGGVMWIATDQGVFRATTALPR
jgi:hypothetical protein